MSLVQSELLTIRQCTLVMESYWQPVEALDDAGADPNDIMVFFGEIDRASSSFGGGRIAPPVV
jgi:hypothetical protein